MTLLSAVLTSLATAMTVAATPGGAQTPVRKAVTPQVTVEIIASEQTLFAGETWIGIRFILGDGWHIYWRNPGDSGSPPVLRWTVPTGVTISEIEWPVPERIAVGPMTNYGYHGDVVLPVRLRTTAPFAGPLTASATWVVCKEICVSGKAMLGITFPLMADAASATPAWKALIERARARVPVAMPEGWSAAAVDAGRRFDLTVTTGAREAGGAFFSQDEGVVDEAAPQSPQPFEHGLRLSLKKSGFLSGVPRALRGVVVLDSGRAVDVIAPVSSGRTPSSKE